MCPSTCARASPRDGLLDTDIRQQSLGGEEQLGDVSRPQQPGGQDQHLERSGAQQQSLRSKWVTVWKSTLANEADVSVAVSNVQIGNQQAA